jgi:hypothetical protein
VTLELRDVEVRAAAPVEQSPPVVEEVEAEVEQPAGDLLPVDEHMLLGQVPAARAHDEHGRVVAEPIGLLSRVELDRSLDRVDQVRLPFEVVSPGRCVRILEVGHEAARAGIEGVDDHLAVDGTGDLDPAVLEVSRHGCDAPVALANVTRLREEVRQLARVEPCLALGARGQELATAAVEAPVQVGNERERVGAQKLLVALLEGRAKLNPDGHLGTAHGARLVAVVVAVAKIRARAVGQLGRAEHDHARFFARNVTTCDVVPGGVDRGCFHNPSIHGTCGLDIDQIVFFDV